MDIARQRYDNAQVYLAIPHKLAVDSVQPLRGGQDAGFSS